MFWRLVLATCKRLARDLCQSWKSHVLHKMGQFFKLFQFSLEHFWLFISFLTWTLSNSSYHSQTNFHLTSFHSQIFKKKVWVFSLSLHISCFELCFLGFVIRYWVLWYLWFRLWAGFMFVEFGCLGLVDLVSRFLNMVTFMFHFSIRVYELIYVVW